MPARTYFLRAADWPCIIADGDADRVREVSRGNNGGKVADVETADATEAERESRRCVGPRSSSFSRSGRSEAWRSVE